MKRLAFLFLAVSLAAASCAPGRCIHPKDLTYKLSRTDDLVEGTQGKVELHIVNRSGLFMLVDHIGGSQVAPTGRDSLVGAQYGALTGPGDDQVYFHNPLAQQETPAVFAYGLIPPGQRLRVQVDILPTGNKGALEVFYVGLSLDEVAQHIFFPTPGSNPTALEYTRVSATRLGALPVEANDGGDRNPLFNVVLLDDVLVKEVAQCLVKMDYRIALKEPPLRDDLEKRLGEDPTWKVFSNALVGWVAGTSKGIRLLTEKEITDLPDSPPAFFVDLDKQEKVRIKICDQGEGCQVDGKAEPGPGRQFLKDFSPLYAGDGKYTVGTFQDVNRRNAVTFLRLVNSNFCRLQMTYYFMDSYYFEVKCDQ